MRTKNKIVSLALAAAVALPLSVGAAAPAMAASAPPPSCNNPTYIPSPTERQVVAWYEDFLKVGITTTCNDPGRFYWTGKIDNGASPASVLGEFLRTRQFAQVQTTLAYNELLGRNPDAGAQYWVNGIQNGMAVEWVRQNILASSEYVNNHRSSSASYVDSLYRVMLGRGANAGEANYWNGRINQVGTLAAVREIWYSPEAVRLRIDANYRTLLRRGADGGGLSYWYNFEVQSDLTVQARIATSAEYFNLSNKRVQPRPGFDGAGN